MAREPSSLALAQSPSSWLTTAPRGDIKLAWRWRRNLVRAYQTAATSNRQTLTPAPAAIALSWKA